MEDRRFDLEDLEADLRYWEGSVDFWLGLLESKPMDMEIITDLLLSYRRVRLLRDEVAKLAVSVFL